MWIALGIVIFVCRYIQIHRREIRIRCIMIATLELGKEEEINDSRIEIVLSQMIF
jgi:hypothetical protein